MVLPAVAYQPADLEAQRRAQMAKVLAAYNAGVTQSNATIAAQSPYAGTATAATYPAATHVAPSMAQGTRALGETNAMWNAYNASNAQNLKDWIDAIAGAGNEQRLYYNVRLGEEAAKNKAALAARSGGGRGGGRGGGGGGGRRSGGGGRRRSGGGGGGGGTPGGYYAPGPPGGGGTDLGAWVDSYVKSFGSPQTGGAPRPYTPAPYTPAPSSYTPRPTPEPYSTTRGRGRHSGY